MSKMTTLTCDCGCGVQTTKRINGWLVLEQLACEEQSDEAKIDGTLHFATLKCLMSWTQRASVSAARLKGYAAKSSCVRGRYIDKEVPGLYV